MRCAAIVLALGLALAAPAAAAETPLAAFIAAWAGIDSYTSTITVHETDGKSTQDRVYHYAYRKPHFAKTDIVAGPGRGGGAVWTGGDSVRGHQGGFLSGIKLNVPLTDGRAVSLRGDTIEKGSFQSIVDDAAAAKAEAVAEATIDGVTGDGVALTFAAPRGGVTREVVIFSRTTHLPLRRTSYAGETLVKMETFSDVKLGGLTEANFN